MRPLRSLRMPFEDSLTFDDTQMAEVFVKHGGLVLENGYVIRVHEGTHLKRIGRTVFFCGTVTASWPVDKDHD